mmetsp:Transcript_87638/g.248189  ORF Transcript_87638/g.248189 Transcript_87638/m.248189 type:complete len:206 (+) Transcript_87638:1124-1741(+)
MDCCGQRPPRRCLRAQYHALGLQRRLRQLRKNSGRGDHSFSVDSEGAVVGPCHAHNSGLRRLRAEDLLGQDRGRPRVLHGHPVPGVANLGAGQQHGDRVQQALRRGHGGEGQEAREGAQEEAEPEAAEHHLAHPGADAAECGRPGTHGQTEDDLLFVGQPADVQARKSNRPLDAGSDLDCHGYFHTGIDARLQHGARRVPDRQDG